MISISRRKFLASASIPILESAFPLLSEAAYRANPKFHPDPRVQDIFRDLASPLHANLMRDPARVAIIDREVDLSRGYSLEIPERDVATELAMATNDFHRFMSVSMGVNRDMGVYRVRAKIGVPSDCPPDSKEAFRMEIGNTDTVIVARDADGIRRGLFYLQDEMLIRRAPFLPIGSCFRWAQVEDRIIHSPVAPYRWLSGWELEQDKDFYPDEYLNKIAHSGMNGIWVAGLLNRMLVSSVLPELGQDCAHDLEKLKRLVKKAQRYGIKVYLFCIEPRTVPEDHPVFAAHPEIRGAHRPGDYGGQSLCTSTSIVREYIREMMRELFRAVPNLGGVINIFNGERATTCWLNEEYVQTCPRCRLRTQAEVLSEDLNCFMEGIRQANPDAKLLAWGYGIRVADIAQFMQRLNKDVAWLDNFDHGTVKFVNGKRVEINEYSLSTVGPSKAFENVAAEQVEAKRSVYAKIQTGTTYELSSVPYIPLPSVIYDKVAIMHALRIRGSMMTWIIGGYPSTMLKMAGEASFAPLRPREELLERLAAADWGPQNAKVVREVWEHFAETFHLYLSAVPVFYYGPITRCPSYHLHLEKEPDLALPYNWGLTRQRQRQPYEDGVTRWTGPFTSDDFIQSFRDMAARWREGLDRLRPLIHSSNAGELQRQYTVAAAVAVQLGSAANVIEFYTLRDQLLTARKEDELALVRRMRADVLDDIKLANEMHNYVDADSAIGFESEIYGYSYSPALLREKIMHDSVVSQILTQWEQTGVDRKVLLTKLPSRMLAATREGSTWQQWLRWGD
jgi:hypothetical protein